MAGDGAFLIDLTLAHFWLGRLHIDYGPLSGGVRSLYCSPPAGPGQSSRIIPVIIGNICIRSHHAVPSPHN